LGAVVQVFWFLLANLSRLSSRKSVYHPKNNCTSFDHFDFLVLVLDEVDWRQEEAIAKKTPVISLQENG
jgi:hypothetical protein